MTEDYLFGDGPYQNWVDCYPAIRKDLYFVMDDSWDIPKGVNDSPNPYLGTVELSPDRFPSFGGDDVERLRQLSLKSKAKAGKVLVDGFVPRRQKSMPIFLRKNIGNDG